MGYLCLSLIPVRVKWKFVLETGEVLFCVDLCCFHPLFSEAKEVHYFQFPDELVFWLLGWGKTVMHFFVH